MDQGNFYQQKVKPAFDKLFAVTLLFLLSPILFLLLIMLSITFSGRPFFIQPRVGKNNQIFWMLKFKSMKDNLSGNMTEEERVTKMGRLIRGLSLDEIPQLINVIRGEMSIVGPRPLLVEYLPYYNKEEKRRHLVKPGITGLAQVCGRNKLDWGERLKLDVLYTKKISFVLDIEILMKTLYEVFRISRTSFEEGQIISFKEYASKR